jgi:hypothetical protein
MARFVAFAVIVSLFVFASPALPQSATSADIEGVITDPAGAAIPGAKLTVLNKETGVERGGESNSLGRYRIAALPASVRVRHPHL